MYGRETDAAVAAASVTSDIPQDAAVVVRTATSPAGAAAAAAAANASPRAVTGYEAADTVTIETTEQQQPVESVETMLGRLILHEDRPIENLPEMQSSELKLIGRCVSLCVKQSINGVSAVYYYTGLVSMVTDTTVTLAYVNRYTRVDFKFYQSRERHITDPVYMEETTRAPQQRAAVATTEPVNPPPAGDLAPSAAAAAAAGTTVAGAAAATLSPSHYQQDPNLFPLAWHEPAGSLTPALRLSLTPTALPRGEMASAATAAAASAPPPSTAAAAGGVEEGRQRMAARPRFLHTCDGSIGVLPFVTFMRTNIHDVSFGRDPSSDFYALFQDPAKAMMDLQFLRTFVRRYLVHTSEHNNPRQVPLYVFLTTRCGCPNLDRNLANQLVREELPRLLLADRAIAKEKRKQRTREARLNAAVQDYRAPAGLFANTGVLYLTQIPQQTLMSGTVILVFTVAFALFLIISLTTTRDSLVTYFVVRMLNCFIPSVMVWAMTGLLTVLHATTMRLPLRQNLEVVIARLVFSTASVVCAIASVSVVTQSLSTENVLEHLYRRRYDSLCAFYDHHQCSGFYYSCHQSWNSFLCSTCVIDYPGRECYMDIWQRLQFITMPLIMFAVFILLGSVNAIMVLLKLYLVARSMSITVFT